MPCRIVRLVRLFKADTCAARSTWILKFHLNYVVICLWHVQVHQCLRSAGLCHVGEPSSPYGHKFLCLDGLDYHCNLAVRAYKFGMEAQYFCIELLVLLFFRMDKNSGHLRKVTCRYYSERDNLVSDMRDHFQSIPESLFPTLLMLTGEVRVMPADLLLLPMLVLALRPLTRSTCPLDLQYARSTPWPTSLQRGK